MTASRFWSNDRLADDFLPICIHFDTPFLWLDALPWLLGVFILSQSFGIVNRFSQNFWIKLKGILMYEAPVIANRIKLRAKQQGLQLKNILEECGLSKNTLSSMLSGGSTPKSENLGKIADVLDCSVDYLLGRTDKPEVNR